MPTLASCTIVGHAYEPAKPLPKSGQGKDASASVRFYTADRVKNSAGEWEKQFTSHNAVIFGNEAEWLLRDCVKGTLLAVTGTFRVRKWEKDGKSGAGTEIRAQSIRILDRKEDAEETPAPAAGPTRAAATATTEDEPPF